MSKPPIVPEKKYYRPDEVARLLRVTRSTVYFWVSRGKIGHIRTPGGLIRISRDEIEKLENIGKAQVSK